MEELDHVCSTASSKNLWIEIYWSLVSSESSCTFSTSPTDATMAVCSVGVGSTIDGGSSGGQVLPPSLGHQDHDGHHHSCHQDQSSNGNTNCKAPLWDTECVRIIGSLKKRSTWIIQFLKHLQQYYSTLTTSTNSSLSPSSSSRSSASLT